ncbi:acyl carrier protein [Aliikangiella marina]|uniref:Acyl carrier protein n=2 Tax=Aliikangiella marina TaxID=1712262 RepID=A0A545TK42_9GAMM|nr:acyl carrier protein [Aliikangiella marina]
MKNIELNEDFFDLGVSSLTVVELQIVVEKQINRTVETAKLMAAPTIAEWVELYSKAETNASTEALDA